MSTRPVQAEFTLLKRPFVDMPARATKRYRCDPGTPGTLSLPDGIALEAWVWDVSETGIGLTAAAPLLVGLRVAVRLRATGLRLPVDLVARVIHATPVGDGTWRIGCQFTTRLAADDLDALLL